MIRIQFEIAIGVTRDGSGSLKPSEKALNYVVPAIAVLGFLYWTVGVL